jgi:hypothetical protein
MGGAHEEKMKFKYSTKTEQLGIDCFCYTYQWCLFIYFRQFGN